MKSVSLWICAATVSIVLFASPRQTVAQPPPEPGVCCPGGTGCVPVPDVYEFCYINGYDYVVGGTCPPLPNSCVSGTAGACCIEGQPCQPGFTELACLSMGGNFLGAGSTCAGFPCGAPPTGACCQPGGVCSSVDQLQCNSLGGVFFAGAGCDPNPCAPGACCNGTICNQRDAWDCIANGFDAFLGAGTSCTPNPCALPDTGACCLSGSQCQPDLTESECQSIEGTFLGIGTTCSGSPCGSPPGSCCLPEGGCEEITQTECNSMGGLFMPTMTCSPNPCGPGACCNGTTCNIRTAYDCIAGGFDAFHGAGTTCTPNPCLPPPSCETCPGDVNGDSILSGSDISAFTTCTIDAAGGPPPEGCNCADMDNGGSVDMTDVNAFVSALLAADGSPCE